MIHIVEGFGIVNKAEIDVYLELSCCFDDPTDVGNLISGEVYQFYKRKKIPSQLAISFLGICPRETPIHEHKENTQKYLHKVI